MSNADSHKREQELNQKEIVSMRETNWLIFFTPFNSETMMFNFIVPWKICNVDLLVGVF